jgi:hypothetical protein
MTRELELIVQIHGVQIEEAYEIPNKCSADWVITKLVAM